MYVEKHSPYCFSDYLLTLYYLMITDSIFDQSKPGLRKISLLLTIPCAIMPMLLAAMGMMTSGDTPLFFQQEKIIFSLLYVGYASGLWFSWRVHHKALPIAIYLTHIGLLVLTYYNQQLYSWATYGVVITLILTSIVNQYYRLGTIACTDECTWEKIK